MQLLKVPGWWKCLKLQRGLFDQQWFLLLGGDQKYQGNIRYF